MKHTELPWVIMDKAAFVLIYGPNGERVCKIIDNEQDAAFIVRACNNHDKLLAALKLAREAIATLPIDILGEGRAGELVWPLRDELLDNINKAIKEVEE